LEKAQLLAAKMVDFLENVHKDATLYFDIYKGSCAWQNDGVSSEGSFI